MSAIVPWTYPGGPPCCCVGVCPDLGNGPNGVEYSTATRHTILLDTYNSLYAGGVMSVSLGGNARGTAVSVFDANNTCTADSTFNGEWEFDVPGNSCTFVSNSTNRRKISGNSSTPSYSHYLENVGDSYTVFFALSVGGTVSQDCGFPQATVAAVNRTVNAGDYPPVGGSQGSEISQSSLSVILPLENISVPTYLEVYGTNLFFAYYINNEGSVDATFTWTPAAP